LKKVGLLVGSLSMSWLFVADECRFFSSNSLTKLKQITSFALPNGKSSLRQTQIKSVLLEGVTMIDLGKVQKIFFIRGLINHRKHLPLQSQIE
jgi:hypothetical protein